MIPNEIYGWTPISETTETGDFDFVLETEGFYLIDDGKNVRVVVKYYADHPGTDCRCFKFFSVWFNGRPFMICEVAGRPDHKEFYVTDYNTYNEAIAYLKSISTEAWEREEFDPDKDAEGLGRFYGTDISKFYNPDGVDPKYKVGDIVIAKVPKGHGYNPKMIETPVKIIRVQPFNPFWTYHGTQIARKCADKGFGWVDCPVGEGNLGAQFNDDRIVGPYEGED